MVTHLIPLLLALRASCVSCVQVREERYVRHTRFQTHGASDVLLSSPSPSVLTCLSTCSLTKPCKSSIYSKDSGQCQLLGRRLDTRGTQATLNTDNKMRYYVQIAGIHYESDHKQNYDKEHKQRDVQEHKQRDVKEQKQKDVKEQKEKEQKQDGSTLENQGVVRSILVSQESTFYRYEISLVDKTVSAKTRPNVRYEAMGYDWKHNKVIVATGVTVISINLSTDRFGLLKKVTTRSLAVDSEEQWVFLTNAHIYRMTTTGRHYTTIVSAERNTEFTHLTIERNSQMIFARRRCSIYRVTYGGQDLELMLKRNYCLHDFTVYSNGETIFYAHRNRIRTYHIPSTEDTSLARLGREINQLIYYDGKLYVAAAKYIFIADFATNYTEKFITSDTKKTAMCLITE